MFSYCLCILLISLVSASFIEDDGGVLVLSKDDFTEAQKQFKHLLVEFYSPWCGHCKSIAPEYIKAAHILREQGSDIKLAKVDATVESELREQYKITGYPTFKFFLGDRNKILDYSAGRHASDFVSYVQRKTGPPAAIINDVEEAKKFSTQNDFVIFGFFKDPKSDVRQAFEQVIFDFDQYSSAVTENEQVFQEFGVQEDSIVAFKKYDEQRVELRKDLSYKNIKQFISDHHLPLVNEFVEENAVKIFTTDIKVYTVLFVSKTSQQFQQLYDDFKEAAVQFRGRMIFIYVDLDEEDNLKVLEFFGVPLEKCPTLRSINLTSSDPIKYNPQTTALDKNSIVNFINSVFQGHIKPFYKTEEAPSDWNAKPVKVLVGKTFNDFIKSSKNVIIEFYAPWCGHCKKLEPIWEQLGEKYENSDKVVVAKLDSTANELEDVDIQAFPTIKLYIKGTSQVIDYTGERTFDALVAFIESDGKIINAPEEEKPEDIAVEVKDEL